MSRGRDLRQTLDGNEGVKDMARKLLLALVASTAISVSPAIAADVAPPEEFVADWTGFYMVPAPGTRGRISMLISIRIRLRRPMRPTRPISTTTTSLARFRRDSTGSSPITLSSASWATGPIPISTTRSATRPAILLSALRTRSKGRSSVPGSVTWLPSRDASGFSSRRPCDGGGEFPDRLRHRRARGTGAARPAFRPHA